MSSKIDLGSLSPEVLSIYHLFRIESPPNSHKNRLILASLLHNSFHTYKERYKIKIIIPILSVTLLCLSVYIIPVVEQIDPNLYNAINDRIKSFWIVIIMYNVLLTFFVLVAVPIIYFSRNNKDSFFFAIRNLDKEEDDRYNVFEIGLFSSHTNWYFYSLIFSMIMLNKWSILVSYPELAGIAVNMDASESAIFALDNLTKGLLLDVLEIYNINLFSFELKHNNWSKAVLLIYRYAAAGSFATTLYRLVKYYKLRDAFRTYPASITSPGDINLWLREEFFPNIKYKEKNYYTSELAFLRVMLKCLQYRYDEAWYLIKNLEGLKMSSNTENLIKEMVEDEYPDKLYKY